MCAVSDVFATDLVTDRGTPDAPNAGPKDVPMGTILSSSRDACAHPFIGQEWTVYVYVLDTYRYGFGYGSGTKDAPPSNPPDGTIHGITPKFVPYRSTLNTRARA